MAQQPHPATDGSAVGSQVVAEDLSLPRRDADQAGAGPQEGCLAGAVGAPDEDHLPWGDIEIDAGEGGEAAEEGHGRPEANGEVHNAGFTMRDSSAGSWIGVIGTVSKVPATRNDGPSGCKFTAVIRRVVRGTGKTLIASGILILLFVAYQLWGTGLHESRAQDDLEDRFALIAAPPPTAPTAEPAAPPTTVPPWRATPSPAW